MGRFKLDKVGVGKIRAMLEHQVAQTQKKLAGEAYYFFTNFGYHSVHPSGPFMFPEEEQGWTEYYAANWNIGIEAPDISVIQPPREIDDYKDRFIDELIAVKTNDRYIGVINTAKTGQTIFVTNSVYYGKWLNDGGRRYDTYTIDSHPNRFIEQCIDHIEQNADRIVNQVAKECPEL